MAKNTPKQYAVALHKITSGLSDKFLSEAIKEFVSLLARDHKLKQSSTIIDEFVHYSKKEEGIAEIEITTAGTLDKKTINKIKQSFGEKVEATIKTDPNILGGIKIKTEDRILDASLKTQLLKLKESII